MDLLSSLWLSVLHVYAYAIISLNMHNCICQLFFYKFKMKIMPTHLYVSVQFSCSVVSNSLRPHESQHARSPCPSPTPGVHSDSCPTSQWCHPAISSSVFPFSSCPQSLPASESFQMSQLFAWGGQSIGVSALASVLPKNTQDWSLRNCKFEVSPKPTISDLHLTRSSSELNEH